MIEYPCARCEPLRGECLRGGGSEEFMKKRFLLAAATLMIAGLLGGCGAAQKEVPLHELKVEKYVTLGDYQNISVSAEKQEASEDDCKLWLAGVYAGYATQELGSVDRAAQDGDTVNIDYEGKLDGVAFEGGTAQGADLTLGSGQFIDGFEDGLIGVLPGETTELTLTFPESYDNAELAGKETVFTVTVNYVVPGNEEDMQDAVVEQMGLEAENIHTIAELKQYLYGLLEQEAQSAYESELQDKFLDELIAQSTFKELPEYLVNNYKELMKSNIATAAEQYGITTDAYTSYLYGMTCDEFVNTYVEDMVKQDVAMQAIANRENLAVDDAELDEQLQKYTDEGGYASVEEFMGNIPREQYRNYFMNEKVLDFLLAQ